MNGAPWPQDAGRRSSHTFSCRMLKRPPDEADSENQEARQQYEIMQCFTVSGAAPQESDGMPPAFLWRFGGRGRVRSGLTPGGCCSFILRLSAEPQSCLICIACRVPRAPPESFATKQDPTGE